MSDASKKSVLFSLVSVAACGLVFSLAACDDSTSVGNDEAADSSSSVIAPESSSVPESSSDETTLSGEDGKAVFDKDPNGGDHLFFYDDQGEKLKNFPICGAENEGAVDSLIGGNGKYGYETYYYKCKKGIWYETDASVTCDTAGVKVGSVCKVKVGTSSWMNSGDGVWRYYVYEGDGSWKQSDDRVNCDTTGKAVGSICVAKNNPNTIWYRSFIYAGDGIWEDFLTIHGSMDGKGVREFGSGLHMPRECTAENELDREKLVFDVDSDSVAYYFKCMGGEWIEIEETEYDSAVGKCDAENEGLVDSTWSNDNYKYANMMYYRCEAGSWVKRDQWITCDMDGVAAGDTCRKIEHKGTYYQYPKERVFVYEGDGAWKELPSEQPENSFPDCSDFKNSDITLYCPPEEECDSLKEYVCRNGVWTLIE